MRKKNFMLIFLQKVIYWQTGSIRIKEYQDSSSNVKELLGGCDAASSPAQPPKILFSLLLQSLQLVLHPMVFLQPIQRMYT
jgi:hypothetical protein